MYHVAVAFNTCFFFLFRKQQDNSGSLCANFVDCVAAVMALMLVSVQKALVAVGSFCSYFHGLPEHLRQLKHGRVGKVSGKIISVFEATLKPCYFPDSAKKKI